MNRIALALAIAAVSASAAAAQSNRKTTWDDLLKPLDVKTDPRIPVAPPRPAERLPNIQYTTPPAAVSPPEEQYSRTPPQTVSTGLLDACIIEATGRLPKIDGLSVTDSSYEFDHSFGKYRQVWQISISVKLGARQAKYSWYCRIDTRGSAKLETSLL